MSLASRESTKQQGTSGPDAFGPDGLGGEQPFISHLVELRDRLIRMVIAILLVFLVLFPFANDIYTFIAEPIRAQLPAGSQMIATQVASPFLTPFKLALVVAIFVAMPYLLYQFWGFIAPGLYTHEKRLAVPLVTSSILLFYLGMLFAYYAVFPLVFGFFSAVTPEGVAQMPDIAFYLEFVLKLFFAFGIAFEIPIATILLVAIGATTPAALKQKRPYVIVGVFVAGMLLTPPDVISQTMLALPMWLLFEAGIFFSRFVQPKASENEGVGTPDGPEDDPDSPLSAGETDRSSTPHRSPDNDLSTIVGDEIDGGDRNEPGRYRPMTDDEMEAELDAIEAEELETLAPKPAPKPAASSTNDSMQVELIETLIRKANELRAAGEVANAKQLLYRVLEEGNSDQRVVARNILVDLDR
ncbi:twin-arginine translocase subunit TatC [Lamprobacter modestohalophilus]|uniref:twin-arginine translocase subunit TatC n=1 Tax=Lamprobacter modestohalophilus TaxID=1064514 RepID=UPI002ADECE66|nr:twin-arginine translocase subunit TatC [Lamprobacter modestohalophilus]MEA1048884.1 twin-arginine translocase subunit TatC [Lamprobacter modestohalophilus]